MPLAKARTPISASPLSDHGLTTSARTIYLFVPNLIGYVRIVLALVALLVAFKSYPTMCVCYTVSQILDAVDGYAARLYGQATLFGAVLDQVIDRLSTVGMIILNSIVYPHYYGIFSIVLICDLGGHWVHTFASLKVGLESHKTIPPTTWRLLKFYYESRLLMFLCHASYEFVWVAVFVLSRSVSQPLILFIKVLLIPTSVFCVIKNVTNLMQMAFGAQVLVALDVEKRNLLLKQAD